MLKKIKIPDSFLGNVLKVASGSIFAQVLGYLFLPLITRLYSPEHFGEFGIFMAMFGIIAPLMGGKFEVALVLEKVKSQKMNLYLFSTVITVFGSLISFLVLLFFRKNITDVFELNISSDLLLILPATLLFFGLLQANKFLLISNRQFGKVSKSIILQKIVSISVRIFIGILNPSGFGLIISDFLNKLATVFYTTFVIIKNRLYVSLFKGLNKYNVDKLIRKYKKFPTYELASDWFGSVSSQLPLLIMAFFFNNIIIGYYVFANATLEQVITLTSRNFGSVYYQKIAEIKEKNRKPFTLKLINNLSIIGIFPFVIIAIGAPEIFSFIFSNKWFSAGVYAQILSPYLMIFFFLKPINSLYRVYNQQDKLFYFNIVNFILFCAVVIVGGLLKNITLTIILLSCAGVFIYGMKYFWILQKMKITFLDVIKLMKKYLLISFGFLFFPVIIKIFSTNDIYFLVSLLLFSTGYILYIYRYEYANMKAVKK